ncbi:PucR family transcriptional regulator [Nocardia spumae]|uniref:PucR family transcriptional regulator n=1 Tax=Nocardia spumae TaxID=2887190 RepID=UPI001D1486EE|nr:helix-turn-helix domain-containing protein [Nocardia spumae]
MATYTNDHRAEQPRDALCTCDAHHVSAYADRPEKVWEATVDAEEQQPSQRVRELFRTAATKMQDHVAEIADEMWAAGQRNLGERALAENPYLAEIDRLFVRSTLAHWLIANIDDPGCRVAPKMIPDTRHYARDLALRGLDVNDVEAWRAAQRVGWSAWLGFCFDATDDKEELRQLVEISVNSLGTYIDDSMATVVAYIDEVRTELAQGPETERMATVQLLLRGAPITRPRAEAQLGYALTGHHVAAILWADTHDQLVGIEEAAERVMRATGAARRLTLVAGTATLWTWMPVRSAPSPGDLDQIVSDLPNVRIAVGRPERDVHGFRRSHLDAAAAQALLTRLRSGCRAVRFEDVQLITLLTNDLAEARQFVADTLGELATAEQVLRDTARVFIAEQFNTSKTADRLFAHRNTIDRRLARVDELLPRPLAHNPAAVDTALALVELQRGESRQPDSPPC